MQRLVGRDRHAHRAAYLRQPLHVEVRHRLLDVLEVELLEPADPLDRGGDAPHHVRVDPDLHARADDVTDRGDRVVVLGEVPAHLELELGRARLRERGGLAGVRLGLVDEQVADDRHLPPAEAAEQLGHRHAERLALEVEERDLEARDRVGAHPAPVAGELLHPVDEPLGAQRILPDEELRQLRLDDRPDGRQGRAGSFADADDTLVGVDLHEQPRGGQSRPAGPDERLAHRRTHRNRMDARDPQRRMARLGAPREIVNHLVIVDNPL